MPDSIYKTSYGETGAVMNADLGLFNQLLQMIDGDWSDSIQGICTHVHNHFHSLSVSLSVFDLSYHEFIYMSQSINPETIDSLEKIGVDIDRDVALDIIKKVYSKFPDVIEEKIFSEEEAMELVLRYFDGNNEKASRFVAAANITSIASFPIPVPNKKFKCTFHVLSDDNVTDKDKALLEQYIPQLRIALEIVFLVRELYIKATHDGLTHLYNHKQGEMLLQTEIERVKRNKQPLTVLMLDIDRFKLVNDQYGHQAGNEVLKYIGTLLPDSLRKCDIISRYGGEEFLICLPDTDIERAIEVSTRIKDSIQHHTFHKDTKTFSLTVSIGAAFYDENQHVGVQKFIEAADEMLYKAKANGRNRIEYQ